MTPQAVGYARVSTAGQAEEGVSLAAQEAAIRTWATAHGYDLRAVEVDAGLSGGRADNRPALQRALEATCKARGVLVAYSLSRLARSVPDAYGIMRRLGESGARLVSLTEGFDTGTSAGRLMYNILASFAEFERDVIAERTSAAIRHKASRGEYTGGAAPYGYRAEGGRVVPVEDEQAVIRMVRQLAHEGLRGAAIARRLNRAGVPCRGSGWHARSVGRILAREKERAA